MFDPASLADLYDQYSNAVYRYAYRLLGDADAAEDCVAETFRRMLLGIRQGIEISNVKSYLYRIAHNWSVDYYRRQKDQELPLDAEVHASAKDDPEEALTGKLRKEIVRQAIQQLPIDQQQVLMLRFYEDYSHEETAKCMGKTIEATRALQYRALSNLKAILTSTMRGMQP